MTKGDNFQSGPTDVAVLYAEEEHLQPNAASGAMIHSQFIIECCTEGKGTMYINQKEFTIQEGDVYVLLPGSTTSFRCDYETPRGGFWCVLEGFAVETALKKTGVTAEAPFLPRTLFEPVRFWLQLMTQHWPCKDEGAQLRQTACAYGLLGALLQNRPAQNNAGVIEKVIGFIKANYHEEVTLNILAQQAGLERTYFSYLFKQKTGLSPHNYLTQVRIRKAAQLLGTRKHTISEVAYLVGLTPHNFSRQFRQVMGMTAKTYCQLLVSGNTPTDFPLQEQ